MLANVVNGNMDLGYFLVLLATFTGTNLATTSASVRYYRSVFTNVRWSFTVAVFAILLLIIRDKHVGCPVFSWQKEEELYRSSCAFGIRSWLGKRVRDYFTIQWLRLNSVTAYLSIVLPVKMQMLMRANCNVNLFSKPHPLYHAQVRKYTASTL